MTKAKQPFGLPGIFDNVRDGLVLVRFPQREIVMFNRAASELVGMRIPEAMGSRLDRIFQDPEVHTTAVGCSRQPVGVWPGHDQTILQTTVRPAKAASRDVELHFCRVDDVGQGGALVLIVMRPSSTMATEAAEQGESALTRLGQLEEQARQRALLFSTAAHEFNTPLAIVALQAELLQDVLGPVMPVQAKALGIISANVHRLVLLSQDLMDLARADAGRLVLATAPMDLAELVRRDAAGFDDLAQQQGIAMHVVAKGPAMVLGDRPRVQQVVANFIGNAIKFTPRGGKVTVTVAATPSGAALQVTDTGPGMDAQDLARIFRPFVRIDSPGAPRKPGTGLGLYLSKRIVEAHGGAVGCSSPGRGKGMTFWLRLPEAAAKVPPNRARLRPAAAALAPRQRQIPATPGGLGTPKGGAVKSRTVNGRAVGGRTVNGRAVNGLALDGKPVKGRTLDRWARHRP